ncbi:replication protein RepA [Ensifer adhaerens]|uniref:replication protein RepA n=1 Tax=Ensifer adhaerens TaxID=106592 RepID=UPI003D03BA18
MSDKSTPDLSQIRDPDLRQKLAIARDRFKIPAVFAVEANQLIAEQQARDAIKANRTAELAAMPREKRRRALTLDHFLDDAPTAEDIRHIHSVLAICGLPYERQPVETREYSRVQGNMGIMVQAGATLGPDGQWVNQPLPFGPKARLILMHLCSEAIRQKSPTIEIADTFTAFVREMGFSDSGGKKGPLTAFREQLNALAACSIRIASTEPNRMKAKQFFPIEDMEVWLSSDTRQKSLWPSTVTFSAAMYESLQRHALPVNARVVRAFQGSARKLDIYYWAGWRIYNINEPLMIGWDAIAEQFGSGFARQRAFKAKFNEEIEHIKEVLPKLPLKLTESGLILQPADPDVLALPPKRTLLKKA